MTRPFRYAAGGRDMVRVDLPTARTGYRETRAAPPATEGFPSHAVQREIAAVHAARVMKPLNPWLTIVAVSVLIVALAAAFSAIAAADRAIEIAERV